jgi:hypothetical protein
VNEDLAGAPAGAWATVGPASRPHDSNNKAIKNIFKCSLQRTSWKIEAHPIYRGNRENRKSGETLMRPI